MKQSICILLCLLFGQLNSVVVAQEIQKQTVYSIIKQQQSTEWYETQAKLWKQELTSTPSNADAWLNYYTANRMLKLCNKGKTQQDLNNIVSDMAKAIPATFEYHYVAHWNYGIDKTEDGYSHLDKALSLGPNRIELLDDLLTQYELTRNLEQAKTTSKKWFESNDMAPGLYAWNYNMLIGLESNAILITSGDNDTYPALVLQYAQNIRTDVAVLNNSLLGVDSYRDNYFDELGIPHFSIKLEDCSSWYEHHKKMIDHIKTHTRRPLYFAVSAQPFLYEDFKSDIYNVGMAYRWSSQKFDNIAVIKRNFEKKYLLDHLKIDLDNHISRGVVATMNRNYLIPLLTLYNHYEESEDDNIHEIEAIINRIARQNDMELEVAQILNSPKKTTTSLINFDVRLIEKELKKVTDTMYASSTETSNFLYNLFLTDLLKQKRYKELDLAKTPLIDWRSLLVPSLQNLPDDSLFANGHPSDDLAPVVNVSYEAAVLYCEWLTNVYNSSTQKRKKYNNVTFRLPSEEEWEYCANGGETGYKYPWKGDFIRNSRGCYITNLNVEPSPTNDTTIGTCNVTGVDGGYFTVRVDSYFPNAFGLYNLIGNAAEMTAKKGQTKGGSWNSLPKNATIETTETYTTASPQIGFRVIMIVK